MQDRLKRLGARLAPPRSQRQRAEASHVLGDLPRELVRFYELTDGADIPRLGARLASLAELEVDGSLLCFAHVADAAFSVISTGHLRGWVVRTAPTEILAFRSVASLLAAMGISLERGVPLRDELGDAARTREEGELGAELVDQVLRDEGDVRLTRWAIPLMGAAHGLRLYRALEHPELADVAGTRIAALGLERRPEWDTTAPFRTRIIWALEHRGFSTSSQGDHELWVERDGTGSWYTIELWLASANEPGGAARAADRIVNREERRRAVWSVGRDEETLTTGDLAEVFAWCCASWDSLSLACGDLRFSLWREGHELLISFEQGGGSWQSRMAYESGRLRMVVEHVLLRRARWPQLAWDRSD